ncbi:sugar ABC transporter permease [Pelagibacteraceae bacterium]|jgi:multiple sugar transport system permease protein|nr:sugar ABC transporter permease [Pelagibacteraceae bacterium]MDC3184366.1 sugar ABC transporter permease [Pelagibacteraceae bacterium]|tara:strand:+ start:102 stop:995 length:894 start_codon:yes stop_codon:yes gene_type:complete
MNFFKRQWMVPYLFLAPALIGTIAFKLYPIFIGFWESLIYTSFSGGAEKRIFVWFENYQYLFDDKIFWKSLEITAFLTIIINPLQIAMSLGLALLLMRKSKFIRIIRSLYLLPIGIALPIATIIWGLMLDPNQGLINGLIGVFGIPPQPFLVSENQALWCIIAIATWKGVAFWMLFLLAGLEDIPKQYYEAAEIDGATPFQKFRYVTIPQLKRTILFVFVADTAANFVLMVPMIILTKGGPLQSTNVLIYEGYRSGFYYQDWGRSLSIITILTVITLIVIGLQLLFLSEKNEGIKVK